MSFLQRQGTPDTSPLLSSSSGGGGSAPPHASSSPLRIDRLDRIDSRSSRDFAWHPHPPPMPGSSPSTGGGFLGPRLGSSSSLGGGATGYQSIEGHGLTLSRSSSSAADVFSAGSGLLLREGEDPEGRSPRERNRRCPFVIGVAGGTGEGRRHGKAWHAVVVISVTNCCASQSLKKRIIVERLVHARTADWYVGHS